jgi:hypothetical protein
MATDMRGDSLQPGQLCNPGNGALDGAHLQLLPALANEQSILLDLWADNEPLLEQLAGIFVQRQNSLLRPFPRPDSQGRLAFGQQQVTGFQIADFGNPQPGIMSIVTTTASLRRSKLLKIFLTNPANGV